MALFSRIAKGLQTLFPASGTVTHSPGVLREEVNLVHEFPGRVWQWERVERFVAITSPAVVSGLVTILTAGENEFVEVLYASIGHNSATAVDAELGITFPGSVGATFVGKWTNFAAALTRGQPSLDEPMFGEPSNAGGGASDRVTVSRPLFLFPNSGLILQSNPAAAAAFAFTVVVLFIRHPYPERPLL